MNKTETQKRIDTAKENLASENIEQFPSVFQMARNLAKQAWLSGKGAVVGQGFLTTAEKAHSRLTICESCEFKVAFSAFNLSFSAINTSIFSKYSSRIL